MVHNGLDHLVASNFARLRGRKVGFVCNQATVTSRFVHALDLLVPAASEIGFELVAAFGPQHGIWGHTQDNMIEWEGYEDPRTGVRFFSLYGEHREPTPAMLEGIDLLVIDLPDIGSRYYTFMWTMAFCLKACEPLGIEVLLLDRPNPIGGLQTEGTVLEPEMSSFVGLYPLPTRHAMTLGEIARYLHAEYFPRTNLSVEKCTGWSRQQYADECGSVWTMPSPNMPTVDTAVVYPGACLIEGTQLSEGRGTTRPFEIVGAPYIDGWLLAEQLNRLELPGAFFRPIQFLPTFQKHAGQICQGVFVHVLNRREFEPVLTYCALISEIIRRWPNQFKWADPPYEYVWDRMPFDILAGNAWLRPQIEEGIDPALLRERFRAECQQFQSRQISAHLYS